MMLVAQTEFDAQKLMQTDIYGTARYMGLAGAMGALGGDASAIKDNPAGLGVYRKSEITATYDLMTQGSSSEWNSKYQLNGGMFRTSMNNFNFVISSNSNASSGLISSNWSFSYNRIKNFNREIKLSTLDYNSPTSLTDYIVNQSGNFSESDVQRKFDNNGYLTYNPYLQNQIQWLPIMAYSTYLINPVYNLDSTFSNWVSCLDKNQHVIQTYNLVEQGYLDEYSLGWSANFDNKLYFGVTGNIKSLKYTKYGNYQEDFGSSLGFNLCDTSVTSGMGLGLNIGLIYKPSNFIRFGLSIHNPIPTFYSLNREHYTSLYSTLKDSKDSIYNFIEDSPLGSFDFRLSDPMKINASVAFVFGKFGLLSLEYNFVNLKEMQFLDINRSSTGYQFENINIKTNLNNLNTYKCGLEIKLNENLALRGGYSFSSAAVKDEAKKVLPTNSKEANPEYFIHNYSNSYSCGIGYRNSGFFIDFGYVLKNIGETFTPYNFKDVTQAKVLTFYRDIVLTVGLRF
jgi:hypothetical protein